MKKLDYLCWYIWKRIYIKIINWHLKCGKPSIIKNAAWQINLKWWRLYRNSWVKYEPISH